jgi:hypothetical protein
MRKAARKAAERAGKPLPPHPGKKRDESNYHKGSCDMRKILDPDRKGADPAEWEHIQPGDFWWGCERAQVGAVEHQYRVLWAKFPDGCLACLPLNMPPQVKEAGIRGASWGFDGNLDRPTLTPSVHHVGHWHGYIRAGRMVSV